MFNKVFYKNRESTPFILAFISLDPDIVHHYMKDTRKDIKDATYNYLVSDNPTRNSSFN